VLKKPGKPDMKKTTIVLISLAMLISTAACTTEQSEDAERKTSQTQETESASLAVNIVSAKLPQFSDIADAALPELTLISGDKTLQVKSCQSFINIISDETVHVNETTHNMHIYADYQPCIAAWLVSHAQTSKTTYLNEPYSSQIINQLDLSTFRSSLGPRLDKNKKTLADFAFKDIKTNYNNVMINDNSWTYEFTLLARGDFTGDGTEDLLVRFLDQAEEGTYFSLQTLVLERGSAQFLTRARDAKTLLGVNR
jgi:hypothetical protein